MPKSGLPIAKSIFRSIKIGSLTLKTERPSETSAEFKKAILSLERAGKAKIFTENARYQI